MRVLVSGSAGFMGSRLMAALADRDGFGHVVTPVGYDALLYRDYPDPYEFRRGDVTDTIRCGLSVKMLPPDAVVWTAAIVGDGACTVDPARSVRVNLDSVKWLAENYDGPLVFLSSCSVYGVQDGVADESSPMNPQSLYAETKIRAEEVLQGRPRTLVLRLGTLHGTSPRMRFDLVVNAMTLSAVKSGVVEVFGGNQYRPLLSVKDAAQFIARMVVGGWAAGTYNLASENLTVLQVAEQVRAVVPGAEIKVTATTSEDKRNYRVSVDKARTVLGFCPRWCVHDSAQDVAELVQSGRLRDTADAKYYNNLALKGR